MDEPITPPPPDLPDEQPHNTFTSDLDSDLQETEFGKVKHSNIVTEMQRSYLDYAMSVIVSRALPDVRDGLKPVHRRILYAMKDMGLEQPAKYVKCAKVVGEVLGKYHPHGDSSVYEALVRLAQDFTLRYPLVDGQGNFGSVDGDSAAAMRYTECRLSKISSYMLADIDKATVPTIDNFDNTIQEPTVLPSILPNLLLMGAEGIAVGMATKIPPHNLNEIGQAILASIKKSTTTLTEMRYINNDDSDPFANILNAKPQVPWETPIPDPQINFQSSISLDDLIEIIPGPDFPTAAYAFDKNIIRQVYATGKGSIPMRAKTDTEETKTGKTRIIVTELPYQVNKADLVAKIADLVRDRRIEGISDLRDESDRTGMRIVIELKKDAKPKSVLNQLYKHTPLQNNFPANIVALVDGTPQQLGLKQILHEYIRHRHTVVIKRSQFDLRNARYRAHILEGLKIALDHIDEIIKTIRASKDTDEARTNLINKFGLTEIQSNAILEMQLRKLSGLERQKIEDEYNEVMVSIQYLEGLLTNPEKITSVISDEIKELLKNFGDERRTKIIPHPLGDFNEEDLVPKQKTVVAITNSGYVKRLSPDVFRQQNRGGKGVSGMTTKTEDDISHVISAETHDHILFFTNKGRVFKLKVWELPEGSRISKGSAIVNLLNVEQGENVQSILTLNNEDFKDTSKFILLTTIKGTVKKTSLSDYMNIRTNGLIAIKLQDNDQLAKALATSGQDHLLLISHQGKSIRFSETDIRPTGRDTMGVIGMKLSNDDFVVGSEVITQTTDDHTTILVVMENGLGKKTPISQFPLQGRGGQGVKIANVTSKTGAVVSARLVNSNTEALLLTTKSAQIIKLPISNIPTLGRATQGVILMRPRAGDIISAVAILEKEIIEN